MRMHLSTDTRMKLRGTCLAKRYAAAHAWLITCSGGRFGARLRTANPQRDPPLLVLETVGRRSGKLRASPLLYLKHGDGYVVCAANAGHPAAPAWWLNLQTHPNAFVRVDGVRVPVRASEVADAAERARLWQQLVALYDGFAEYERNATRIMPVIHLRQLQ